MSNLDKKRHLFLNNLIHKNAKLYQSEKKNRKDNLRLQLCRFIPF